MSDKIETLKAFTRLALERFERAAESVRAEDLDWRACEGANTIRWIMTHAAQLGNVYIWKTLADDWSYWPEGWPRDYVGNPDYSLEKIKADLERGGEQFMEALDGVTEEKLAEEVDFGDSRPREYAVMFVVSEVIHHGGQLAHAVGTLKRQREG